MLPLVLLVLAGHVFVHASAMSLCNNTLFSDPSSWGAATSGANAWLRKGLPSPTSPVPPPAALSKTCRAFEHKKEVCCDNATVHAIESAFVVAQTAITAAEDSIDSGTTFAKSIVTLVSGTISKVCELNPPLIAAVCHKLMGTIDSYTQRLIDNVRKMAVDQAQCASAIATYAEGMACFACEVQFKSYLDLEQQTIRLSSNTCDAVYDRCAQSIQNDVNELLRTVTDFTGELMSELAGDDAPIPSFKPPVIPDMCGGTFAAPGDCRKFICHSLLNGFDVSEWLNWSNWMSAVASLEEEEEDHQESGGNTRHLDASVMKALAEKPARVAGALRRMLEPASKSLSVPTSSESYNEYSEDGYDAFGVGCRDLKTCPGMPWWGYALLCVGAVAVVGGIAFFVVQKTKKRNGGMPSRAVDNGAKGPDASYGSI